MPRDRSRRGKQVQRALSKWVGNSSVFLRCFITAGTLTLLTGGCGILSFEELGTTSYPEERNQIIAQESEVWITFSIPPVKEEAEPLLTIKQGPQVVTGDRRWEGNKLLFKPTAPFSPGTRYTFCCNGMITAEDGRSFELSLTIPFFAGNADTPPSLTAVSPDDGQDVERTVPLVLSFSNGMNTDVFLREFSLEPVTTLSVEWNTENDQITITPETVWDPLTVYRWTVPETVPDASGVPLAAEYSGTFVTQADKRPPELLRFGAATLIGDTFHDQEDFGHSDALKMTFSEDIDMESLEHGFSIDPVIEGDFMTITEGCYAFVPEIPYGIEQEYAVTLSTKIHDKAGNFLEVREHRTFVPVTHFQEIESITVSAETGFIVTTFKTVYPNPISFTGPDDLLTFQINFREPYTGPYASKITDGTTLASYFPPNGPTDPRLEQAMWDPGGSILTLVYIGFEKSPPDSPQRNLYKLVIPGGREASQNQDDEYLEEDVWIILEAERED